MRFASSTSSDLGGAALAACLMLVVGATGANAAQSDPMAPARVRADFVTEGGSKVVASDPRISGTWVEESGPSVVVITEDGLGEETAVWWNAIRIDNAEGDWVGHSEGYTSESLPTDETIFLVGDGAYEGLSATLFSPAAEDREPGSVAGRQYEGVIFPVGWLPVSEPAGS
jgi:hypothetical protein